MNSVLQLFFPAVCFVPLLLDAVVTGDENVCWGLGRRSGRRNGRTKVHDALQHHEQRAGAVAREIIVTNHC